jgi:hypothetical protein
MQTIQKMETILNDMLSNKDIKSNIDPKELIKFARSKDYELEFFNTQGNQKYQRSGYDKYYNITNADYKITKRD